MRSAQFATASPTSRVWLALVIVVARIYGSLLVVIGQACAKVDNRHPGRRDGT
jgi:hypothetical protein